MSDGTPGLYRINLQHLADDVINERYEFGADLGFGHASVCTCDHHVEKQPICKSLSQCETFLPRCCEFGTPGHVGISQNLPALRVSPHVGRGTMKAARSFSPPIRSDGGWEQPASRIAPLNLED